MAFYTHDGLRHETKQEAIHYLENMFITETLPFEDDFYQGLHKEDYGYFDLQAIPVGGESAEEAGIYLELTHGDANVPIHLSYRDAWTDGVKPVDVANRAKDCVRFITMVHSEAREHLEQWSKDGKHLDLFKEGAERDSIQVSYQVDDELGESAIRYSVEGIFDGELLEKDGVDTLDALLKDIESFLLTELTGEFDNPTGKLGDYSVDNLLASAGLLKNTITITVETPKDEVEETDKTN